MVSRNWQGNLFFSEKLLFVSTFDKYWLQEILFDRKKDFSKRLDKPNINMIKLNKVYKIPIF